MRSCRRLRPEEGQTAAEYVGLLLVIALVVAAVAASGIGAAITTGATTALCRVTGGPGCGPAPAGGEDVAARDGAAGDGEPAPGGEPAPAAPPAAEPEDGRGFWDGARTLGGAFVNGLVVGDFNDDDRTDDGWTEGFRAAGQILSGVLVVGDVRDGVAAGGEIVGSGGRDGWGDLAWSLGGAVPVAGDLARGGRSVARGVDVARGGDEAAGAGRAADGAPPGRGQVACAPNSFLPGTRVLLADGTALPIEAVTRGTLVWAADPLTGASGPRPVTHLITGSGTKDLVDVTVGGATVTATAGHPFWVPATARWTDAADLRPGDTLLTATGTAAPVTAVTPLRAPATVHNLSVAGLHTFHVLAGPTPVLTHNQRAGCGTGGAEDGWRSFDEAQRQQAVDAYTTPAATSLPSATVVRGSFPRTAQPGSTLVRRDAGGNPTHYQVYGPDGEPLKRVDLTGAAHRGVPTPHVVNFRRDVAPGGGVFTRQESTVRPAEPWEVP